MESMIYLIRHGESDHTAPRSFLGWTDPPFNDNGIRQALELSKLLQDIPFTRISPSPLQRAMQTAVLVGGILPASVQQVASFMEINLGAWEGLTVNKSRRRFPGEYDERGRDMEFFRAAAGGCTRRGQPGASVTPPAEAVASAAGDSAGLLREPPVYFLSCLPCNQATTEPENNLSH